MDPPRRRPSLRWHAFDYRSVKTYGVTICVQDRLCILGTVLDDEVLLTPGGFMVDEVWREIPRAFPFVRLDAYVVMPNHVHGIVQFRSPSMGVGVCPESLGHVIRWWKVTTTKRYAHGVRSRRWPPFARRLWQRGYYDRVLRNDDEIAHARGYIARNPAKWAQDPNNPERRS